MISNMKTWISTLFWTLIVVLVFCHASPTRDRNIQRYRIVCVHVANSFYRLGNGKFTVENIDPNLCTHLLYGYAGVHNNKVRSLDGYLDLEGDFGKGNYKKFNDLRDQNPYLTTLLTVGGRDEGAIKFSELAKDSTKRAVFVQSCMEIIEQYGFDGINLDWQFPAHRGGPPGDKEYFTLLLKDLRSAFDKKGFVLTAAVAAQKDIVDLAYEVDKVSSIVDFLNVLTYDFRHGIEKKTGIASPLYASSQGRQEDSVDFSVNYWVQKGASRDKLVVGLSFYGQTWTLSSGGGKQLPGANASGPGEKWPYTRDAGIIGYNEFCESQKDLNWLVTWSDEEKSSFASQGNQWICYENAKSVSEKSKYVVENKLGGILLNGIESDDTKGLCSVQKYPLVNAAYEVLQGEIRPTPIILTTTTSSTTTTTTKPSDDFRCKSAGFFRDPKNCNRYFQCIHSGNFAVIPFQCPDGTVFDQNKSVCTWKHLVPDCA